MFGSSLSSPARPRIAPHTRRAASPSTCTRATAGSRATGTAAVLVALALAACGPSIESVVFATRPSAPRPEDHPIRIYRSTRPPCSFEEVGFVLWKSKGRFDSLGDGAEAMRDRARELGGDAIVDFGLGREQRGVTTRVSSEIDDDSARTITSRTQVDRRTTASGTVVRYTEDGCDG